MSTTSLPEEAAPEPLRRKPIAPPVLASDILREEVAPLAPARTRIRVWLGAFSAVFAAAAALGLAGIAPRGIVHGSIATAAVALVAALIPARYVVRAAMAGAAGLVPLALGAAGDGPLAAVGFEGVARAAAGLLLATALPAALLFRARYRAFRAARVILAVGLAAGAPAIVLAAMGAAGAGPWVERAADGGLVVAALAGFVGFMGAETTAGCANVAAVLIVAHGARIAAYLPWSEAVRGDAIHAVRHLIAPLGDVVSATLVAYAGFQILASLLATEARKVDIHQLAVPDETVRDRQDSLAP